MLPPGHEGRSRSIAGKSSRPRGTTQGGPSSECGCLPTASLASNLAPPAWKPAWELRCSHSKGPRVNSSKYGIYEQTWKRPPEVVATFRQKSLPYSFNKYWESARFQAPPLVWKRISATSDLQEASGLPGSSWLVHFFLNWIIKPIQYFSTTAHQGSVKFLFLFTKFMFPCPTFSFLVFHFYSFLRIKFTSFE